MPSISLPGAVLGAGALGVGASIYSATKAADASTQAAQIQAQSANTAANTQLGIYNQTRSDLLPYNLTGQSALSQLAKMFGLGGSGPALPGSAASLYGLGSTGPTAGTAGNAFSALTQYPGYQFGLNQGVQALDRSAASRGLLLSGGQLKDAQTFGQNYAQQTAWQPYLNQLNTYNGQLISGLQGIGSLGENAGAISGNQGITTGQGVASSQLAAGQAQASGIVGSANAINAGIGSGINTGLNSGLLAYSLGQYGVGTQAGINAAAAFVPP